MRDKEKDMAEESSIRGPQEKTAAELGRLLDSPRSLPEEQASTPIKPDGWDANEQMAHLCEMESTFRAWGERAMAQDGASLEGVIDEPVATPSEPANQHTVADLVSHMVRQHEATLQLIATLKLEDYDRRARNSVFGTLTVLQWLRSYYRHDRMHHDQLRSAQPSYQPRYLSRYETNKQRPTAGQGR
jgi:hypothetical protein